MPTLVYRYGLRAPTQGAEIVEEQMRAAHRYRNRLVELERARRAKMRELEAGDTKLRTLAEKCQTLDAEVLRLVEETKEHRKKTRTRSAPPGVTAKLKDARAKLKDARKEWRDERKAAEERLRPLRDAVNEQSLAERKAARAACGVYWGTYQLIEDADNASRKAPLWEAGEPNDPRFMRWEDEGAVSVQISDGVGLSASDLDDGPQLRLIDSLADDLRQDGSRRKALHRRCDLWLRVGSTEDRKPVWAVWPMVMHRALPAGARIKRATVHRRKIGPRVEWCVTLTIGVPEIAQNGKPGFAVVVPDVRMEPDGSLHVATIAIMPGATRSAAITLPREIIGGIERVDTLRSTRDSNFDEIRKVFGAWLKETRVAVPEWMREMTETMHAWRAPSRLAALAIRWRGERFSGDNAMFDAVEGWRKQDKHLWCWETSQHTRSLRRRREVYRVIGARMAEQFGALVIDGRDLRSAAKKGDEAKDKGARVRGLAAVSEMRSTLINAFRQRGGSVHTVEALVMTRTCPVCGSSDAVDLSGAPRDVCSNGHDWRDGLARDLFEHWCGEQKSATARADEGSTPSETRWERAKRKKQEREERMGRSKGEAV